MHQSSMLCVGMAGHNDPIAVASVANDPSSEAVFLGAIGSRPCDIAQLLRKLQSTSQHLVFVDDAGPGGSWLSR
jgi:hypothetical protein